MTASRKNTHKLNCIRRVLMSTKNDSQERALTFYINHRERLWSQLNIMVHRKNMHMLNRLLVKGNRQQRWY
jgi:hypothetical protein